MAIQVNSRVVNITGTTTAGVGKAVTILVTDKNNKIVYINQDISKLNSSFEFMFTLPSDAVEGEYKVLVGGDGLQTPNTKNFLYPQTSTVSLTAPVLLPLQVNDITDKTVKLSWSPSTGGTGTVTYTVVANNTSVINNLTSTSYQINSLLPLTNYAVKIIAKDSLGITSTSSILNITTSEVVIINTNETQISCVLNNQYSLIITGNNIKDFQNKVFSIKYDPAKLEAVDLCSLTKNVDLPLTINVKLDGTNIIVTEFDKLNGKIKFKLDKNLNQKQWRGAINIIKFKSLADGVTTTITQEIM